MELIEKISYNIAIQIGEKTNKNKEEIQVINYGLFMLIHTLVAIILTIAIAFLIRKPIQMITITIVASSLKRYSGGVHATSPNRCLIIGLIMSITLTYMSEFLFNNTDIVKFIIIEICTIGVSFIIFYKKAPVGNKAKPLKKQETRIRLRKKLFRILNIYYIIIMIFSILIINSNLDFKYSIYIYCLQLGILLQAFSLTKLGEFFILKIDKILKL